MNKIIKYWIKRYKFKKDLKRSSNPIIKENHFYFSCPSIILSVNIVGLILYKLVFVWITYIDP